MCSAYKDTNTGKVIIAVCGIEKKYISSYEETWKDAKASFMSTAGAVSKSTDNLVKFAEQVKEKYGHIDGITGHSLGGYLGMQLKVIGDSKGFLSNDTTLHTYDIPGMTHSLAGELKEKYGITEADIKNSLHTDMVVSVINDKNSYNTLGALPGVIMTATDPAKTQYRDYALKDYLPPRRHFLPFFDKSFGAGENAFTKGSEETQNGKVKKWHEGDNHGHSYGPVYSTAVALGVDAMAVGGAVSTVAPPVGIPIAAAGAVITFGLPQYGQLQGAAGKLAYGNYQNILHETDPTIIDGKRPKSGEQPQITAYANLNNVYNKLVIAIVAVHGDPVMDAKKIAEKPENLRAYIQTTIQEEEISLSARSIFAIAKEKLRDMVEIPASYILANKSATELPTTTQERQIMSMKSALEELKTYEQDYKAYENNKLTVAGSKISGRVANGFKDTKLSSAGGFINPTHISHSPKSSVAANLP